MHIIRDLADFPAEGRGGAVTIGNFDGVHRGHVRIVHRVLERAEQVAGPAVVFTFDPHPVRILRPHQCPPPLTWTERKAELLAMHGIDWIVAYPTDDALLRLTAMEFFNRIICDVLQARALVEGPNFYFGHNREGNVQMLGELSEAAGITLDVVEPVVVEGELVSSSRIRQLISAGNVGQARKMLSAPYRIRGMVTHGAGRGARLGYPTANLDAVDTMLPAHGVYAGWGWTDETKWPAAVHVGPSPTFGEALPKVEVHLIGRTEPLYGQPLEVEFLERLRDIQSFDSSQALIAQLNRDMEQVQSVTGIR